MKRCFYSKNESFLFRPHYDWRNMKTQQSPLILEISFFRKTWARKSHYYRDAVVFEKHNFSVSVHTKTQSRRYQIRPLWGAFLGKLRFRNALMWTVRRTVLIKVFVFNFLLQRVDVAQDWYSIMCLLNSLIFLEISSETSWTHDEERNWVFL